MQGKQSQILFVLMTFQVCAARVATVDGDINIAGLFEIQKNDGGQCGAINKDSVMILEATRWYIEQLNMNNALPFKIGFQGYKTCGLPNMAIDHVIDISWRHRNYKNIGRKDDFFVGFLGPAKSEEAKSVAALLSSTSWSNRFLQISPSATASILGDRSLYPNFYRVIPDDSKQIMTMVELMKLLSWNRIAIIYENDINNREGALFLKEQAEKSLICISAMLAISLSPDGDESMNQINAALDTIMLKSPVIEGAVLFASKEVTNKVLIAVDTKGIDKVPLFILSESAGLQGDVFQTADTILQKTKGSMIVSTPSTEITSFSDYWLSLVTNVTILREKSTANPWLIDMYESVTGCNFTSLPSCQGLSVDEAQRIFPMQPVHLKNSILAAHTMVKALSLVYNKLCHELTDCLSNFKNMFEPHMMTAEMKTLSIDFGTDFNHNVSVEPLTSAQYRLAFGNISEPVFRSDHEVYGVYNYRKQGASAGVDDFILYKVGSLTDDDKLDLNFDALRDYDSNGAETSFPNVRKGQCPAGKRCSECIRSDISDLQLHVPGDLYIIGLAPVNNKALSAKSGCGSVRTRNGYQLALAMQYATEEFNQGTFYSDYRSKFGDKQVGLIVLNTCDDDLTSTRKVMDLEHTGVILENGEHLELSNKILGYIGGLSAWVSAPVGKQLTQLRKVQVSYASTYPFFSDKTMYPYFMRIVTKDDEQAEAMMQIVKALHGEYIQVLHSYCPCGVSGIHTLTAAARKHGVCIAQDIEVKLNENYFEYYDLIRRKPHAKLVIVYLNSQILTNFMRDLNKNMQKGEFQFIGATSWGTNTDLLQFSIAKGAVSVSLTMDAIDNLTSFIQNKVPNKDEFNPWLEQYIQTKQGCHFDWSYDKTFSRQCTADNLPPAEKHGQFKTDAWCTFASTSVLSLLMGSAEFYAKSCGTSAKLCEDFIDNPSGLVEELKKISMDIYGTGNIKIFDDNGDGTMGYQIYNVQEDPSNKNVLTYVKVGQYNLKTGLDISTSNVEYPTKEEIVSSCPNEQACQGCFDIESKDIAKSKDTGNAVTTILGVLVGVLVLTAIILAIVLFILRRSRSAKEDPYITPNEGYERPDAIGELDSPHYSDETIQEANL